MHTVSERTEWEEKKQHCFGDSVLFCLPRVGRKTSAQSSTHPHAAPSPHTHPAPACPSSGEGLRRTVAQEKKAEMLKVKAVSKCGLARKKVPSGPWVEHMTGILSSRGTGSQLKREVSEVQNQLNTHCV